MKMIRLRDDDDGWDDIWINVEQIARNVHDMTEITLTKGGVEYTHEDVTKLQARLKQAEKKP